MFKILKYLKDSKLSVLAITILLVLQAFCDLALPQYTADIVDVGIGQYGIRYAAPEKLRAESMEALCGMLSEADAERVRSFYEKEDGIYVRNSDAKKDLEELDSILTGPMAQAVLLQRMQQAVPDEQSGEISQEQVQSAMALMYVQQEYEALGMDLGSLQTQYLLTTGGRMLLLSLLMMATAILVSLLASRVAASIGKNLRKQVFEKVVSFSHKEMDQFSTASLITRCTNDIQQVQMVSVMLLRIVLYAPILGIGGVIKVMGSRTGMGWIIGVAVALILLIVIVLMQVAMPKFKKMQELVDRLNLVSREILTGVLVIRAFSREKYEEKRFDKANKDLMGTQLFTNRVMNFMMPLMMLIMNGITLLIVWFGAKGIDLGNLQVGDMLAFITYTMQIVMSFLMLTMISVMLPRAGVAAGRIEEVLAVEPSIHDPERKQDKRLCQPKGELQFHHVSFRYPNADGNALQDIDFTAEPGKTTAIIGGTGCGKSTLLHLIPRFYDVTEGQITIDGVDIRQISQHRLRSLIGFVPQKGVLFSGTIASNLKFAGENVTDEQMESAARIAQAEDFILAKPEGYDSPISQGGTNVSGGQKQRLSIARAIAGNPKIFLFDDSFSALDYKTDAALRKALKERVADATVIIVAQRISTILHADKILVLEDGAIAGMGTHEELLRTCEAYQEIARSQLSEAELAGARQEEAGKKEAGREEAGQSEAGQKEARQSEAGQEEAGQNEAGQREAKKKEAGLKAAEQKGGAAE